MLRPTICCRCLWFRSGASAKKYDLLSLFVVRSGAPVLQRMIYVSKWCPSARTYDLLPLLGFEVSRVKKYDLLRFEVVPQC